MNDLDAADLKHLQALVKKLKRMGKHHGRPPIYGAAADALYLRTQEKIQDVATYLQHATRKH